MTFSCYAMIAGQPKCGKTSSAISHPVCKLEKARDWEIETIRIDSCVHDLPRNDSCYRAIDSSTWEFLTRPTIVGRNSFQIINHLDDVLIATRLQLRSIKKFWKKFGNQNWFCRFVIKQHQNVSKNFFVHFMYSNIPFFFQRFFGLYSFNFEMMK